MATGTQGLAGLARRYATALYELADQAKALDAVADDLRSLRGLIAESEDFSRLVFSPMVGRDEQSKAVTAVLERAKAHALTVKFVGTTAMNRRLFALPGIIDAYLAELAMRRGEVTAEVTSASSLDDKQVEAVTDAVKKSVGAKVSIDLRVDPAIIGGLIVKVGSRMVDNSIRSKLQRLQHAMKGVG